jgi:hypothetical protein
MHLPGAPGHASARDGLAVAAMAATAVAAGAAVARSPVIAAGLTAVLAAVTVAVFGSRILLLKVMLALSPWLVVFSSLVPPNTRTAMALAIGVIVLMAVAPLRFRSALGPVAAAVFAVAVLCGLVFADGIDDIKQGIGFLVFPAVAVAVLSERGREILPLVRNVTVYSGLAALSAHLVVISAGLGRSDTKYGVGEKLGLVAEEPHEMALLGVVIAAAGLTMSDKVSVRSVYFGIGALPAVLSGVRSAMVGIVLVLVVMVVESRLSARSVAVLGIAAVFGIAGGAGAVIAERLNSTFGEGVDVNSASAVRTDIWSAALGHWVDSGPVGWLFGTGLTSIPEAVYLELGLTYVGHSDVVEIGVQVGLVALIAWALLWLALFRGGLRAIVFVPVVVYAVINGAIGYAIPLTLALVLAAACRQPDPDTV